MLSLRRCLRPLALVQALLYVIMVVVSSGPVLAQNAAPTATFSATNLANLQSEIDLLKSQVSTLTGNMAAVESAAAPLVQTGQGIVAKVGSFPTRVEAFRRQYGIPVKNPSVDEEWRGVQRYLLEKGGMSPKQAEVMAARMGETSVIEHLKQPFRPQSIAMAVGAVAAMNIYGQVMSGEGVDVGKAVAFVKEPTFWGGMIGSGVGYGLASFITASLLPPGMGVLAAMIPTFAGMCASIVGWDIGSAGGKPIGEVLKGIDLFDMVGRAAGSSLGIIMGGQLALVMFGGLGAMAGPLGAIAGAMILGGLGAKIMGFVRDFFKGDTEAIGNATAQVGAFLGTSAAVVKRLTDAGVLPPIEGDADADAKASELHSRYSELYLQFTAAQRRGDGAAAVRLLVELRQTRTAYENARQGIYAK